MLEDVIYTASRRANKRKVWLAQCPEQNSSSLNAFDLVLLTVEMSYLT